MVLRDDQWERIKDLLPGKITDCGVTAEDNRLFLEAVLWINRTGAPWRDLPKEFGLWNSVYKRYNRWSNKGLWNDIFLILSEDADFESIMIYLSDLKILDSLYQKSLLSSGYTKIKFNVLKLNGYRWQYCESTPTWSCCKKNKKKMQKVAREAV